MVGKLNKTEEIINNTLNSILERLKEDLSNIKKEEEVYFWDVAHEEIDGNTPQDNQTALKLIEDTGNLEYADEGLIDNSSLNRQLVTSAYCCLEISLVDKDFFQYLQKELNNEKISKEKAKEILKEIEKYQKEKGLKKVVYEDYKNQVFLWTGFKVSAKDFKPFIDKGFLNPKQIIDLSNGVKILTSNKKINHNAMVLENKPKGKIRFYLMEEDQDIDIRNLLKGESINEENGFNLSPSFYLKKSTKEYEKDKKQILGKKDYKTIFKDKDQFLKKMVKISQNLTERTC